MIAYSSSKSSVFADTNIEFYLTDRFDGVSQGSFESFNLGENTNDIYVKDNKKILKNFLHTDKIFYLKQIHSDKIITFQNQNDELLGEGDGIVCEIPDKYMMITIADCHPILLYTKHKFAILHAGRAGLEKRIISKAIHLLKPHQIYAFVGVGIKKCCYEIKGDLLQSYKQHHSQYLVRYDTRFHLDMSQMIKNELTSNNITNIECLEKCSHCNTHFYSYRRNKDCGRFALIAKLKT